MSLTHPASFSRRGNLLARIRDRVKTISTVRNIVPSGASPATTLTLYSEHCEDTVDSPGAEHTLLLEKIERFYDPIGGNSKNGVADPTYTVYDGTWMYEYQQSSGATHISVSGLPSNNTAAIQCLARSNPSKPAVDVPLFAYELREIPALLKYYVQFWKKHGRQFNDNGVPLSNDSVPEDLLETGNILLSWHYGIKPLISDIQKMMNFVAAVKSKEKIILALSQKGGIHSRVKVGSDVKHLMTSPVLNSEGGIIINGNVGKITQCQMWATTRWFPDPAHPLPTTQEDIYKLAIAAAFGLDVTLDTLYNAMPWTWLIDWFSDLGDYVSTFRNTIPAQHSKVCVMKMTSTSEYGQRSGSNGLFMTGGKSFSTHRTTKTRAVMPFVLPEAHIDTILNARQWSILGALGLQRVPRETTNRVIRLSDF